MSAIAAPAPDPASRAEWIEARQFAILMDGWLPAQLAVLALWALLGGLLLWHAPGLPSVARILAAVERVRAY